MWIKEKPTHLFESGRTKANFLYNKDKVYVMDNHLCATWCWLQKVDCKKLIILYILIDIMTFYFQVHQSKQTY